MVCIDFQLGTLVLHGPSGELDCVRRWVVLDDRIASWRAEACAYAWIVTALHRAGVEIQDRARAFHELPGSRNETLTPRPYQAEAIEAWEGGFRRGVVVLPTGAGKSFVARLAIERVRRSTLIVVPTLDLMEQWVSRLESAFGMAIGMLGGGTRELGDITVSTYESALLTMEFHGNRFGFLIVDECHHLPGATYQQLARMCLAPFRLGLTATPERDDGGETVLEEILGPICYRRDIDELEGDVLSPYRTIRLEVDLDADEMAAYRAHRETYVAFLRRHRINMGNRNGWNRFLTLCGRQPEGREAFDAYLAQKRIARTSRAKYRLLWELIKRHAGERMLIFTADNATAYAIGTRFVLPVLTHHTKVTERRAFLEAFRDGRYPVLVTSRVLNEGVDVPHASVGVVVSGSGSIREHVQRLGRILRPVAGKKAVLYELVSAQTSESHTSERRRRHRAYQRSD